MKSRNRKDMWVGITGTKGAIAVAEHPSDHIYKYTLWSDQEKLMHRLLKIRPKCILLESGIGVEYVLASAIWNEGIRVYIVSLQQINRFADRNRKPISDNDER